MGDRPLAASGHHPQVHFDPQVFTPPWCARCRSSLAACAAWMHTSVL